MKRLLIAVLVVAASCQSVLSDYCGNDCQIYKYTLQDIDRLLIHEANNHRFNLHQEGGTSYLSRAQYILGALNGKIRNSYQPYQNQPRYQASSGNGFGCKQLEDEILAKSKEFGIEKIGLESNLNRLRKVFNYQDERDRFNENLLEEANNKTQTCVHRLFEYENVIKSLNSKNSEQAKKIKQQEETIKSLDKEKKRLQAKLNNNAPAIHGETGKIYPEVNNPTPTIEADGSTVSTTTEIIEPPASSNATDIDYEGGGSSPIPDIDLRNSGDS